MALAIIFAGQQEMQTQRMDFRHSEGSRGWDGLREEH